MGKISQCSTRLADMDPINCMHVEPNGKTCRRVAYNRLYYCRTHSNLYPDAGTRKDAPPRPETGTERDARMREEIEFTIHGESKISDPHTEKRLEPPAEQQMAEDTPDPETSEEVPEVTDWDEVQKEDGWWDDALPDATPEEQMKEALTNAEASGKPLNAEQIYTVTSLGGEVTTEMFDPSISARFWDTVGGAVVIAVLCIVAPLAFLIGDIGVFLWRITNFEFRRAFRQNPIGWVYLGVLVVWTPEFIIGAAILGAVSGFYTHWTKSRALKRGKADYLDSQEDA